MPRQQIVSERIGKPSGHFSQANAIEARGTMVFISGMTSKRADGSVAGVGDIEAQTRQMCENVKAAVEAAGGTMAGPSGSLESRISAAKSQESRHGP